MTEHACKSCGYHVHAMGCEALALGYRTYARIMAESTAFLMRMNLVVSHCWLPRADWDALAQWLLSMGATVDNPDASSACVKLYGMVSEVDVYAYDEAEVAWAFRETSEDNEARGVPFGIIRSID